MLKIFSVFFIISAFTCGGMYFSSLEKQRVSTLRNIITMISVAETQLRYLRVPVAELMKNLSENNAVSELAFIKQCNEMLCMGFSFSSAWKGSIEANPQFKKLLPETYKNLFLLGGEIGSTDLEGQLSSLGYYKQIFSSSLCEHEERCKRTSKLCPSLGLLLGISAAIMII